MQLASIRNQQCGACKFINLRGGSFLVLVAGHSLSTSLTLGSMEIICRLHIREFLWFVLIVITLDNCPCSIYSSASFIRCDWSLEYILCTNFLASQSTIAWQNFSHWSTIMRNSVRKLPKNNESDMPSLVAWTEWV